MKTASLVSFLLLAAYAVAAPMSVEPPQTTPKSLPKGARPNTFKLADDNHASQNGKTLTQIDARAELAPSKFNVAMSFLGLVLAFSGFAATGKFYQKAYGRDLAHVQAPSSDLDQTKAGARDVAEPPSPGHNLDKISSAEKRNDYEALGGLIGSALGTFGSVAGLMIAFIANGKLRALKEAKEAQDRQRQQQLHRRNNMDKRTYKVIVLGRASTEDTASGRSDSPRNVVEARALNLDNVAVTLELGAGVLGAIGAVLGIANVAAP